MGRRGQTEAIARCNGAKVDRNGHGISRISAFSGMALSTVIRRHGLRTARRRTSPCENGGVGGISN